MGRKTHPPSPAGAGSLELVIQVHLPPQIKSSYHLAYPPLKDTIHKKTQVSGILSKGMKKLETAPPHPLFW